jgi:hypothetical protein
VPFKGRLRRSEAINLNKAFSVSELRDDVINSLLQHSYFNARAVFVLAGIARTVSTSIMHPLRTTTNLCAVWWKTLMCSCISCVVCF